MSSVGTSLGLSGFQGKQMHLDKVLVLHSKAGVWALRVAPAEISKFEAPCVRAPPEKSAGAREPSWFTHHEEVLVLRQQQDWLAGDRRLLRAPVRSEVWSQR